MSDMYTNTGLAHSTRLIEKIGRWLMITLGMSFFVQGLDGTLPNNISSIISFVLLGLVGLMILAMIGITVAKWRIK